MENTASWWEDPITDIIQLSDGNVASCGLSSVDVQIWSPDAGSLIKELTFSQDAFVRKMKKSQNEKEKNDAFKKWYARLWRL